MDRGWACAGVRLRIRIGFVRRNREAVDAATRALAALDVVQNMNWAFYVCGSYLTAVDKVESKSQRIERLLLEAYYPCRDGERSCLDPSTKTDELTELEILLTSLEREGTPENQRAVGLQRLKVKRLVHYENFKTNWTRQNATRLNAASTVLGARGVASPDASQFPQLRRAEQLDAIVALRDALPTVSREPSGMGSPLFSPTWKTRSSTSRTG